MAKPMCAVFGILNSPQTASQVTYMGLHALQHRGQESAGIASLQTEGRAQGTRDAMRVHKGFGLVLDVFNDPSLFEQKLLGSAAIGHTRYSTSGSDKSSYNIQPFCTNYKRGNLAFVHNGNLTNYQQLHKQFVDQGTLFQTTSDSEIVLHLFAQSKADSEAAQLQDALSQVEGAFSAMLLTSTHLFAARDPGGFRPLALGVLGDEKTPGGPAYCVASETCAFDLIGAKFIREIEPGEILMMDVEGCRNGGQFKSLRLQNKYGLTPCVFEYIYFARPDSMIFGAMVDTVRQTCGTQLAHEHPVPKVGPEELPVAVIPVPDSSNTAALGFQRECQSLGFNCTFELGLIRNHYVGRTFIAPRQNERELKVRCKFNTVRRVIENRVVVLVDDSIVRGTTSKQLIKMVKAAGAKSVHFRVASPPVISPCFYGMDFPSRDELLANHFADIDKMRDWLGADSLGYLSVKGMMEAVGKSNPSNKSNSYCGACFTNNYPVPVDHLDSKAAKQDW